MQQDDEQRTRITAKNALESYAFNMKSTVEDKKFEGKISVDEKYIPSSTSATRSLAG